MLIPIRKRTLENLIDEIGELQVDIKALERALKKKKEALAKEMHELGVTQAEARRYKVTWVTRDSTSTNWGAIVDVLDIAPEVVEAYSRTKHSEYPLVSKRGDVK